MKHWTTIGSVTLLLVASTARAADPPATRDADDDKDAATSLRLNINLPTPTLGGKQLWTDEMVWHDWRIQRHVWTDHYRLLDPDSERQAWGTWEQCQERWRILRREKKIPAPHGTVVVLLHGLGRSRSVMEPLADYLRENSSFTVVSVSYASMRDGVDAHAKSLARVVDNLAGADKIHFVCHSLGNIVLRHYLHDLNERDASDPQAAPPIGRIVMLGPPNQGAEIARRLRQTVVFHWISGESGRKLGVDWNELAPHLATPKSEFGIVAGARGESSLSNPLVRGDDDLVVSVDETKLPGARDFVTVPVIHKNLMSDSTTQEYTLRFLQKGYFREDGQRHPLPAPVPVP